MSKVVITLPAYRSAATIAKTVAGVPEGFATHMIVVDDHSPDNTADLARDLGLRVYVHPANLGYGGNLKTCYAKALEDGASVVVVLHPDNQYEPQALPALVAPILAGDADMTFGSRFAGLGDPRAGGMPYYRLFGNRIATVTQNVILGSRFTEMHSGMRAYSRRCLLSLPFLGYSDDFVFESQILVDAVTRQQRVVEVPIPTRFEDDSSSLAVGRLFRYVWDSITYTVNRSARWGRRGNRWPVPGPRTSTTSAEEVTSEPVGGRSFGGDAGMPDLTMLEPVLMRLEAYLLSGTRIALPAAVQPASSGMSDHWQQVSGKSREADVMIVLGGTVDDPHLLGSIASAGSRLHQDGMLVMVVRGAIRKPSMLLDALQSNGFRLVDWDHVGQRSARCTYGFARPTIE